jgi:hypothetical protein
MYLCGDVVGVIGGCTSPGIDQGFVHIEYEDDLLLVAFVLNVFGNEEGVVLCRPAIEIVFDLGSCLGTVVRKRNWTRKLLLRRMSFSGRRRRLALTTASLMNIYFGNYCNSYP